MLGAVVQTLGSDSQEILANLQLSIGIAVGLHEQGEQLLKVRDVLFGNVLGFDVLVVLVKPDLEGLDIEGSLLCSSHLLLAVEGKEDGPELIGVHDQGVDLLLLSFLEDGADGIHRLLGESEHLHGIPLGINRTDVQLILAGHAIVVQGVEVDHLQALSADLEECELGIDGGQ